MANQPRLNFPNAGHFNSNIAKPIKLDLAFTVDADDAAGLGVVSLKSNGYVQNVFMHTSQTPGVNNGYTNPNPATGVALVQLRNNFNSFLGSSMSATSTTQTDTKIDNSALTAGVVYVITTLGNATLAKWQSVGLPVGVTPAAGVAFVATAVGTGSNVLTSRVQVVALSGVGGIEWIGNPILTANSGIYANSGMYLVGQFLDFAGALVAPADESIINLSLYFDSSSVNVDGL